MHRVSPFIIRSVTAKELLKYELDQAGKQIEACLDGMPEAGYSAKCSQNGMTTIEILEHFCEAYTALAAACQGEKYEWGSFAIEDKSAANVTGVFRELRAKAVDACLKGDDDASLQHAYDYVVGHDNYHVGQLVLLRLQVQPDWNSYAIYG